MSKTAGREEKTESRGLMCACLFLLRLAMIIIIEISMNKSFQLNETQSNFKFVTYRSSRKIFSFPSNNQMGVRERREKRAFRAYTLTFIFFFTPNFFRFPFLININRENFYSTIRNTGDTACSLLKNLMIRLVLDRTFFFLFSGKTTDRIQRDCSM